MGTLALLICTLTPLLGGAALGGLLYKESRAERLLVTFVVGVALIVVPIHALAWIGLISAPSVLGTVVALSLALVAAACWRDAQPRGTRVLAGAAEVLRAPFDALTLAWRERDVVGAGVIAFVGIVLWTLWLAYLAPSTTWDGLWYHEAIVGYTLELGGMAEAIVQSRHQYVNGYPRLAEYLQLWMVVAGGREWIDGVQGLMSVVLLVATYNLIAQLVRNRLNALGYALALVLMPGVALQFRSTLIDVTMAAFAACSMHFITRPVLRARDIMLSALAIGMLAGTKASGALLAAICGLALATRILTRYRRDQRLMRGLALLVGAAAVVAAIGAPTYLRNTLKHQNPIWPLAYKSAALDIKLEGKAHATPKNKPWSEVLDSLLSLPTPGKETSDTRDNGYGNALPVTVFPLALLAAFALLIGVVRARIEGRKLRPDERTLLILLLLGGISGGLVPAIWWARLHLHLVIVALALCAWLLRERRWRHLNQALIGLVLAIELTTLAWSSPGWALSFDQSLELAKLSRRERRVLDLAASTRMPTAIARALEQEIGPGDLVVTDGHYLFLANLWNWSFSNHVRFIDCLKQGSFSKLAHDAGATWVIASQPQCRLQMTQDPAHWQHVGRVDRNAVAFRRKPGARSAPREPSNALAPQAAQEQAHAAPLRRPSCATPQPLAAYEPPTITEEDGFRKDMLVADARQLRAGPVLGDVTNESVRIWIRAGAPLPWRVVLWPKAAPQSKTVVEGSLPRREHDFTATLRLEKLSPSTTYHYQLEVGPRGKGTSDIKTFHTLREPNTAGKLRIVVGADIAGDRDQPIFGQIEAVKPDLALFIGDQMYADKLESNFAAFATKYESNWNIPQLKQLMQTVPTFMMWDDHDIKDNYYKGSSERYKPARLAYELYVQQHNPAPLRKGDLYYQFQAGDISFFVLDVRSHRSNPESPEDAGKSMLGAEQLTELARFLVCAPGTFKVIVTPVTLSTWAKGQDSWKSYAIERERLLSFIEDEGIDNVLVLSGDQHWSAVFLHERERSRFYEFLPTPLSKSIGHVPTELSKEIVGRDDDNFVFGVVDFDTTVKPATVALTLCAKDKPCAPGEEPAPTSSRDLEGAAENVPFTVRFHADQVGPRSGSVPPEPAGHPKTR